MKKTWNILRGDGVIIKYGAPHRGSYKHNNYLSLINTLLGKTLLPKKVLYISKNEGYVKDILERARMGKNDPGLSNWQDSWF
jgi:hypothetical protein